MGYFFVAMTVLLTVFGQIVLKWQVGLLGQMPPDVAGQLKFIISLLLRPWVICGMGAAFGASLFWMASMTKFELSKVYPFMALNFVLVALIAVPLFDEAISAPKIIGIVLVIAGLIALSKG